jgi:microcystin-dependent protein
MDPFVAEIRIFPFNFAPTGWAFCDGQLLPISQNTALFSLLGTTYGGDGKSTFALPNVQGSAPMHPGQGPGLSQHFLGEESGSETVTLLVSEMPVHTHGLGVQTGPAGANTADNASTLARSAGGSAYKAAPVGSITQLAFQAMPPAGGSLPHNNMMPYLTLSFCIALQGVFPPRP